MRLILILLTALSFPAFGQVYKWTDAQGNVHFGTQPPPGDQEQVHIRESKTGKMVTDKQRQMLDRIDEKRAARKDSDSLYSSANDNPSESRSCRRAKLTLEGYQNDLSELLRRGYKQSERRSAEDRVERWEREVEYYCS